MVMPWNPVLTSGVIGLLSAASLDAAFIPNPSAFFIFPTQVANVNVTITYPPAASSGTGTIAFSGLPANAYTFQGNSFTVHFSWTAGSTSTSTMFSVGSSSIVTPGTYVVTMTEAVPQLNAGSGTLSVTFRYASMRASASPNPLTLERAGPARTVVVQTMPDIGLDTCIVYSFSGFPGFIQTGSAPPITCEPNFPPVSFSVSAAANAAPGTYVGSLVANYVDNQGNPVTRNFPFTVIVPGLDILATFAQPAMTLCRGGPAGSNAIQLSPLNGYAGTPTLSFPSIPAGITITPPNPPAAPMPPAQSVAFTVSAAPTAAPRTLTVLLHVADASAGIAKDILLTIQLTAGDFSPVATPPTLTVPPGEPPQSLSVSAMPVGCFAETLTVTASGAPAGVTLSPASVTLTPPAFEAQRFEVAVSTSVAAGSYPLSLTFASAGGTRHTLVVTLVVSRIPTPAPVITSLTPPSTAPGVADLVVRLAGQNFQSGAAVFSSSPQLRVDGVTVLSSSLADVRLTSSPNTATGRHTLILVNLDGGRSNDAALFVYPRSSLGAPLGVTDAAIVFPAEGTLIAAGDAVYPRALLATTGTGTIIASWSIDGGVFDRVTATVAAGLPTEVTAHVPIPALLPGDHTLALVFEAPRLDFSPSVRMVGSLASSSGLVLLAPPPDAVLGPSGDRFRWSLVPFASGYEVLVRRNGLPTVRFRTARAEWTPTAEELERIGTGIREWAVRPVFPGEVPGEPTPPRRFAILPEHVELTVDFDGPSGETGRRRIRWSGGLPGVLYRVEFVKEGATEPAFSALTPREEYELPPGLDYGAPEYRVRVTAYGPGGRVLGGSQPASPRSAIPRRGEIVLARLAEPPAVQIIDPSDGAVIPETSPVISARWDRSVSPGEVLLVVDTTDVTAVSQVSGTTITYRPLMPLALGQHAVTLTLTGASGTWHFIVAPGAPGAGGSAGGLESTEATWGLTLLGTVALIEGAAPQAPDSARLQASTRGDLRSSIVSAKFAGDVSIRRELDPPDRTVQESRNWLVDLGAGRTPWREEARVGYAPPRFLDGAEILTAGLARGAVEARVSAPVAAFSYYHSFDASAGGVKAGTFGAKQQIDAFGLDGPWDPSRLTVRAVGIRAQTEPTPFQPGGDGDLVGLFGRFVIAPSLSVLFEGAHGDFQPNGAEEREGWALKLGLTGMAGTLYYALNVRYIDTDFVNPANPGFTPGGIANRTGGDLSMTKILGRSSLSLQYRHIVAGTTSGSLTNSSREDGGNLSYQTLLTQRVSLSASGNLTQDRGSADPTLSLPAIDRRQYGGSLTGTEMLGALSLSESYSYQRVRDEVMPVANTTVQTALVNANGTIAPGITLSGLASATRSEGSPSVGRTDLLLLSLQPTVAIPRIWVSLQPRATYTQTKNSLSASRTHTEQYQALVAICPPWQKSLFSVQLAGDWMRNRTDGQTDVGFVSRYSGAITIRWGAGKGAAASPATIQPGTTPFLPPVGGGVQRGPGIPGVGPMSPTPGMGPWPVQPPVPFPAQPPVPTKSL